MNMEASMKHGQETHFKHKHKPGVYMSSQITW